MPESNHQSIVSKSSSATHEKEEEGNEDEQSEQPSQVSQVRLADICDIQQLIKELISKITENLFINICRGLFEAHKIIYSFLISSSIMKNAMIIQDQEYNLLLRGQGLFDKT